MAGELILLIDDEVDMLNILRESFNDKGYQCIEAKDGIEAIELARTVLPDVIVLDIMMPNMDGFAVCRKLKNDYSTSHIPIVVLTVRREVSDRIKGLEFGADDYVTKPFEFLELLARVKAVLRRTYLERDCNPLTQLPGNIAIEHQIKMRLKNKTPFAFLYADLDDFKSFNDYYGYNRGDFVIKTFSNIILSSVKKYGSSKDFVGHIGGDDFILITKVESAIDICKDIIENVEFFTPRLFDEEDTKRGYFEVVTRTGSIEKVTTKLTVTIAVANSVHLKFKSSMEISSVLAELKRYGKQQDGSIYVVDRRKKTR
ncbi:MAG: response regulator [bacterium]|nr:response regulator [bacterium]